MKKFYLLTILCALLGISQAWAADQMKVNVSGVWYSAYSEDQHENEDHTYSVVPPTTGSLSVQWRKSKSGIWGSYGGYDLWVQYSTDGTNYSNKDRVLQSTIGDKYPEDFETISGISIDVNTVSVQLTQSGTKSRFYKNLQIPMAKHIRLQDGTSAGTTSANATLESAAFRSTSAAYHINLRSFLMQNANLTYHSSNSEFHFGNDKVGRTDTTFAVLANSCAFAGGTADCATNTTELGNPDNYEVDVYFTPSENANATRTATITIYDGETARATVSLTAKIIPTYYFKATSVAVGVAAEVQASFAEGEYSAASATTDVTAEGADVASLNTTAYYYAPLNKGDYYFQGWYATEDCSGERLSTNQTYAVEISSTSCAEANPTETKYYAKYQQVITAEFDGEGQNLNVDGSYNGISYIRTSTEMPSASSEADFWYEIVNNTPTENLNREGSEHPNEIIGYNPETRVVTAYNAGTAILRLHQKAVGLYAAVDKEYSFTVSKYTTEFTWSTKSLYHNSVIADFVTTNNSEVPFVVESSNDTIASIDSTTLHIYNSTGSTTISASQVENYKWTGLVVENVVTPVYQNNHVPFTLNDGNLAIYEVKKSDDSKVVWENGNGYKMGDGTWVGNRPDVNVVIGFTGIPDTLRFSINAYKAGVGSWAYYPAGGDYEFVVSESATGEENSWTELNWGFNNKDGFEASYLGDNEAKRHIQVVLSNTTRYVQLRYHGSCWGRFEDISIVERKEFKASEETVDFGLNILDETPEDKTIKFHYANAGYKAKMSIDDAHFTIVNPHVLDAIGGEKADSAEIVIRYRSDAVYTATDAKLTISDELGNESVVTLKARTRLPQTITWSEGAAAWTYGDAARDNQASALDKVAVAYATSAESVIAVDGTQLAAVGAGMATITASAAETETYAPAEAQLLMTVDKAELTVTAENKETVYGEEAPALTVVYAGWQGSDTEAVLGGTLQMSTDYEPGDGVGSYSITPGGLEAANYSFSYVPGTLTVNKAELIITAKDTTITDGDDVPEFEVEYEGLYSPQDISAFEGELVVTTDYKKGDPTGNYSITPSGFTSANYTIYYHNGTLTVNAQEEQGGGATAVENTEAETKAVKVIRNGQIYIIRGDKTYTAEGQLVK